MVIAVSARIQIIKYIFIFEIVYIKSLPAPFLFLLNQTTAAVSGCNLAWLQDMHLPAAAPSPPIEKPEKFRVIHKINYLEKKRIFVAKKNK